jgi:type IV secretory pathway TraG/TraD family ATPase VirD4
MAKAKLSITKKLLKKYFGEDADISGLFGTYHVRLPNGASLKISDEGMAEVEGGPEIYRPAMALVRDVWGGTATVTGSAGHILSAMISGQSLGVDVSVKRERTWFGTPKPTIDLPPVSGAYGSAGIATEAMLREAGLTGGEWGRGCRLGEDDSGNIIRHEGQCGISITGPPRSGKQVSLATAMMAENEDAGWLVADQKLELFAITRRRRQMLGPVKWIIPYSEGLPTELAHYAAETDSYNALHFMNPRSESYVIENNLLAETVLVPDTSGESKPDGGFFTQNAQLAISGTNMYLVEKFPTQATLPKMASIVCGPELFSLSEAAMVDGSPWVKDRLATFGDPTARQMKGGINDILRTLRQGTSWLSDPAMQRVLKTPKTPWDFDDLKCGSRPMTIYIGVSSKFQQAARGLTRLLFGCAGSRLLGTPPGRRQANLLADEFPAMGRLSIFETCFSEGAGHGLSMIPICQTSGQLIKAYGEQGYRGIQAGCQIQIFFPPRELPQAEEISALAGRRTIMTASTSASTKGGMSVGEAGQDVLDPHAIMALPRDRVIIYAPGLVRDIIVGRRRPYWEYPEIARLCDANPYAPRHTQGAPQKTAGFFDFLFH